MTTGGVSVGEEDHIKPAIESLGSLEMWKVKMKPGKPLAFGQIQGTPFIGLPGNPVSAFATFNLFARPYLMRMQGVKTFVSRRFGWKPTSNGRTPISAVSLLVPGLRFRKANRKPWCRFIRNKVPES